jgi:hypothetical protein
MEPGREESAWITKAYILELAPCDEPSSKLYIAQFWCRKITLNGLLLVPEANMDDDR